MAAGQFHVLIPPQNDTDAGTVHPVGAGKIKYNGSDKMGLHHEVCFFPQSGGDVMIQFLRQKTPCFGLLFGFLCFLWLFNFLYFFIFLVRAAGGRKHTRTRTIFYQIKKTV